MWRMLSYPCWASVYLLGNVCIKGFFFLVHSSFVLFMLFNYLSYLDLININPLLDVGLTDILSVGHLVSVSSVAQ